MKQLKKTALIILLAMGMTLGMMPATSQTAHADTHNHEGWIAWNVTGDLPNSAGSYYLEDDVTLSGTWTVSDDINLCLNGKTITGTIFVDEGKTLNLYDCSATGVITCDGIGNDYVVHVKNGGTFNMFGGVISPNGCDCGVENDGKFNMTSGSISRESGSSSGVNGGVLNGEDGEFNMEGGTISGLPCMGVYNNGTFTMSDGTISGNEAKDGGGVYNDSKGAFTMPGGTISGNTATGYGGGVYNKGTFTMSDNSTISGNKAFYGGGGVSNNGTFTMNGGEISGNTVYGSKSENSGGGVYNESTFTMNGGEISGNEAKYGGGVYNGNEHTFNMSGGEISGNEAYNGGGVDNSGNFNMSGGEISGNTANNAGGGVNHSNGSFRLSGNPKITGNTKTDNNTNTSTSDNVYLDGGNVITIADKLTSGASIGVNMKTPGTFTSGWSTHMSQENDEDDPVDPSGYFTSDSDAYVIALTTAGEASFAIGYREASYDPTKGVTYEARTATDYIAVDHDTTTWENGKTYVVSNDQMINKRITVNGTANLILCDGSTLTAEKGITVTDDDNNPSNGSPNTLNIYGQKDGTGKLLAGTNGTDTTCDTNSAGIGGSKVPGNNAGGTVIVHGGNVTAAGSERGAGIGGVSGSMGGIVTVYGGSVTATGGNNGAGIGGNKDTGGIVTVYGGNVTAAGGENGAGIGGGSGGDTCCGSNVYIHGGTVTATGGEGSVGIGAGRDCSDHGTLNVDPDMYVYGGDSENLMTNIQEFQDDYERYRYMVVNNVAPDTHSFTYSASGATITATCGNTGCPLTNRQAILTIAAPQHAQYNDGKDAEAGITDANGIQGEAKVKYQTKNGDSYGPETETAPTDAGEHKASITLGTATASVEYIIAKADPVAIAPAGLTATYGQTLADVTLTNPTGNTKGTWAWADATTSVGNIGEKTFKANFTPTNANYNSKENVDVTITVNKKTLTVKALDKSIKVGEAVPDLSNPAPDTDYTVTGLVGTDTLTGLKLEYLSTPDITKAGTYSILASGATASDNYTIDYQDGTLTISENSTPTPTPTPTPSPVSIQGAKVVLSATAYTYNGKVRKPEIKTIGGMSLKEGVDYTAAWSNASSKNVGAYTVTITGKGIYTGTTSASYRINPKGTSLKKISGTKKAATVRWKKQAAKMSKSRITGYQIQLATDKKFTKNKKTVTVKGYKKTSKTVKKLKGKKKYYVRIRTYKTVSGTKHYSSWSKTKAVKTR